MKSKKIQVLLIFLCVSTFFIVKDGFPSKNPFEKLEDAPNTIWYIKWSENYEENLHRKSNGNDDSENHKKIIDYLKSIEYKKLSNQEKLMILSSKNVDEEYWFRYNRLVKTGENSSELLTEKIKIKYIVNEEDKYFVIKSRVKSVKSGSYEIISEFDADKIKNLLRPVE